MQDGRHSTSLRVHSRLNAVDAHHHTALKLMLARYALVVPVRRLSNASRLISRRLGWSRVDVSMRLNRHGLHGPSEVANERRVIDVMGAQMRHHNRWDIKAYAWVEQRFTRDINAADHELTR